MRAAMPPLLVCLLLSRAAQGSALTVASSGALARRGVVARLVPIPRRAPPASLCAEDSGGVSKLFGRFRKKREVEKAEPIVSGQQLPDVEVDALLFEQDAAQEDTEPLNVTDVPVAVLPLVDAMGEGTTLLVGMPGAFTPTCNDRHLPGYVNKLEKLKSLGVERVAVMTTNDRFVNSAWRDSIEACMKKKSGLIMLSDGDGDAVKALGLVEDMGYGLGVRSQRFVLVLESGVVQHVAVDEGTIDLEATSAEAVIRYLSSQPSAVASNREDALDDTQKIIAGLSIVLMCAAVYFFGLPSGVDTSTGYQPIPPY